MKSFTIRFPDDLARDISEAAGILGISKSEFVRRAVERPLKQMNDERSERVAAFEHFRELAQHWDYAAWEAEHLREKGIIKRPAD